MYTIDDLKNNSDAQIMVGSILFFLLAFPFTSAWLPTVPTAVSVAAWPTTR